jgi:UDPglucose 6-dehydrogenase
MMKIGVVGNGFIGSALARFFASSEQNEVVIYDKYEAPYNSLSSKLAMNACDLVFVCVPTPSGSDGLSCETSGVEEVVEWVTSPICVKSTVIPGTTERLGARTGRPIGFSPEYMGESPNHCWPTPDSCGFLIVGGPPCVRELVVSAYQNCPGSQITAIYQTDSRTAELAKYMTNCFLALKVVFANQFYEIAQAFQVDYDELRRLVLADPRIGESHTRVTEERGFAGRCIPKDLAAMIAAMEPFGGAELLRFIMDYNANLRNSRGANAHPHLAIAPKDGEGGG